MVESIVPYAASIPTISGDRRQIQHAAVGFQMLSLAFGVLCVNFNFKEIRLPSARSSQWGDHADCGTMRYTSHVWNSPFL